MSLSAATGATPPTRTLTSKTPLEASLSNPSSATFEPATTLLYRHRSGNSPATVTEATDEHVAFVDHDRDGHLPRKQIDRIFEDEQILPGLGLGER